MEHTSKLLRPELLHSFGGRLHSGVIDLRDMDDVMFRAECVAFDLRDAGLTADEIVAPLEKVLQRWTPDIIEQFSNASDGAWDFDDKVEGTLKAIIRRIVLTANGRGSIARTVTEEEYCRLESDKPPTPA